MLSYEKFKYVWEDPELEIEAFLNSTYWNSALSEQEIRFVVQMVYALQNTKTFAEFLDATKLSLKEFSQTFDLSRDTVDSWLKRDAIFPRVLKKWYAYAILSNAIEKMRLRQCRTCGDIFLDREETDICQACKCKEMETQVAMEGSGCKIKIEVMF